MSTRAYREWSRRIESGTFTKSQCQQFAAAVCLLAMGYKPRGKATNLTKPEAATLVSMIQRSPVFLTDEHTAQGLEWLRAKRCPLTLPAGVLDSFSHFTFRGEAWVTDQGYGWASAVPVWRAHLADGRAFDYYANAWQSGNGNDCYWQWVNDTPATPDPVTPDPVTTFGTLHPDGTLTNTRVLARSDILACPHVIFVPEHYREDGCCRCDDPGHGEMAEWGYKWEGDAGKWIAP